MSYHQGCQAFMHFTNYGVFFLNHTKRQKRWWVNLGRKKKEFFLSRFYFYSSLHSKQFLLCVCSPLLYCFAVVSNWGNRSDLILNIYLKDTEVIFKWDTKLLTPTELLFSQPCSKTCAILHNNHNPGNPAHHGPCEYADKTIICKLCNLKVKVNEVRVG